MEVRRLKDCEADERRHKDRNDLGEVGGEQEGDGLLYVVVDATALFAGVDDVR